MSLTIHDLVQGARDRFVTAGISAGLAAFDAEVLARQVLGWDRARFLSDRDVKASSVFLLKYEPLVARRERREPVSYILGTREFWGLDFEVGPDVLIPRPETELIVEETLTLVGRDTCPRIVDVGTGSGCIAVALAREVPGAHVIATDVSPAALTVARRNAVRHGVADRVTFVETSFFEGIEGGADVIVSNPPYVPLVSEPGLTPEIREYEPPLAVYSGEDGLEGVRSVLTGAASVLAPGGWLIMEFGCGQDACVTSLIEATAGLRLVKIRHDLQDIPRTAICQSTDGRKARAPQAERPERVSGPRE
jgi:release factor glutamine methyltransferase